MNILFLQTGGTIDKDYPKSTKGYAFEIHEPAVKRILQKLNPSFSFKIQTVLKKDSLEINEIDRGIILKTCKNAKEDKIIITHGTDTIGKTAEFLSSIKNKTIILTGSMRPQRFSNSDADLNIDDSYVDFSPLASIKGEVGSLSMEIIKDIQNSIIKVGWFREIYKLIESDFETYSQTKIMRPNEEILTLVDEEDTNKDDTDSTRYYFLEFFEKGLGQSTMRAYFQKNIEEVMKNKGSEELFHETLSNGNNLQDFLNEVNRTEERAEKEFDPSIWSTVSRVFQMRAVSNIQDDDIDSTEYSIKAGSPIQRVIIRTDQSERIGISDFQDQPMGNSDDDDLSDEPTQNPDDY